MKAKNRSVIRSAAAVLTLALAAAGCGAKPGNTTHPADSPAESVASTGKSVGIAFPSDETERWKTEGEWLAKRFTSRGYEAKLIYSGGQADRQAKDLASLISGGVSLLIVAPVDAEKLSDPLAAAREAGIPVLSYGSVIRNSDAVTCAVLPDSRQMGVLQAQSVISALGVSKDENAKVSRIELAAGPAEYDGIYATLEPYLSAGSLKIPSGEVRLADVSAGSQEKAESRMEQILKSDYGKDTELAAVLGGTDESARGVIKAVSRSYRGKNDVIVTGSGRRHRHRLRHRQLQPEGTGKRRSDDVRLC